jgi:hypothetical protein
MRSNLHDMTRVLFIARASLLGFGLVLASGCASKPTNYTLSPSDNLDSWRNASSSEQAWLCEKMANGLSEPVSNPVKICGCISTTATDRAYDSMKVLDTAEICADILKPGVE